MGKKRPKTIACKPRRRAPAAADKIFDSPFVGLHRLLRDVPGPQGVGQAQAMAPVQRAEQPTPTETAPAEAENAWPVEDEAIFRSAMAGVKRLGGQTRRQPPAPARLAARRTLGEEAEALAELSDLVAGRTPFELTETEEYVEGARIGLDRRLVARLRRGEFALQGHLDLHRMTREQAFAALSEFVVGAAQQGRRCVLVIHGRGRGSSAGRAVLKQASAQWLSRGRLARWVLAFTSARPCDGGTGASYVLLKIKPRRAPFDLFQGTKGWS